MQLGINEHLARLERRIMEIRSPTRRKGRKVRRTANQGVALWFLVLCVHEILCAAGRVPVESVLHPPVRHFCLPFTCLFPAVGRNYTEIDRCFLAPSNRARTSLSLESVGRSLKSRFEYRWRGISWQNNRRKMFNTRTTKVWNLYQRNSNGRYIRKCTYKYSKRETSSFSS